jgi:RNA polymerase primary sigma factor
VKAKEASKPKGAKGSKEVQQLIDLGRSKGFLTYEEVNDALPQDVVAPDQIDDVISALGDEDIQIVDVATQVKIGPKRIADQEAEEAKKVRVREEDQEEDLDAYYSRSNDPVRMYLRKMGSVSLLTREGEVEIAKRIEDGELMVLDAILNSPIAVREIRFASRTSFAMPKTTIRTSTRKRRIVASFDSSTRSSAWTRSTRTRWPR